MEIFSYFYDNHASLWYLIAGICFVIELTVLGLSGPLLFVALACVLTGILVNVGIIESWQVEVLSVAIFTALCFALLWKPLKSLQNAGGGFDTSSDMIGRQVLCSAEITATGGSIRYSGINWNARLSSETDVKTIAEDTMCEIVAVDGNVMLVKALD